MQSFGVSKPFKVIFTKKLLKTKIEKFSFLRGEPYFFKINKYSFLGARTSYGATVVCFISLKKWTGVDAPKWVTYLDHTPIFEWYVVRCGSKNNIKKDMCLQEIVLCPQNMISFLGLIVKTTKGTYIYTI